MIRLNKNTVEHVNSDELIANHKKCNKCEEIKPINDFYKNKKSPDGLQYMCKECKKEYSRQHQIVNKEQCIEACRRWKSNNREKCIEYDRRYRLSNKEKCMEATRRWRLANPEQRREANRRWRAYNRDYYIEYSKNYKRKYPLKRKAIKMVETAIKSGIISRHPCEICGSEYDIHAHHDDYAKPIEVRWLCRTHHMQWHAEHGPGINGE